MSERLRELLGQLPPDAQVPVRWVLENLDEEQGSDLADLTLEDVANRVGRAVSTIRGWCNSGQLVGAYRLRGRTWRIPQGSLRRFLEAERAQEGQPPTVRPQGPVDLASWRKVKDGEEVA